MKCMAVALLCAGCVFGENVFSHKGEIEVVGDGKSSKSWHSGKFAVKPMHMYRLSFAMSGKGSGGCATVGFDGLNNDCSPDSSLRDVSVCFIARQNASSTRVHLGQWNVSGTVRYRDPVVEEVIPVDAAFGDGMVLGDGEIAEGNTYTAATTFYAAGKNRNRTLASFTAGFNSTRWCMSGGAEVVYRYDLGGRDFSSAELTASIGYYERGGVEVYVSNDGAKWELIGETSRKGGGFAIPQTLLPAKTLWAKVVGKKDCTLQIDNLAFKANFTGEPIKKALHGKTAYMTMLSRDPELEVSVNSLGDCIPGGNNEVSLTVKSKKDLAQVPCSIHLTDARGHSSEIAKTLKSSSTDTLVIPYELSSAGKWRLELAVGGTRMQSEFTVPEFYETSYGELLENTGGVSIWQASSGWKVPKARRVPSRKAQALSIATALNEAEAVQLVVHPQENLGAAKVAFSQFRSATGEELPPDSLEALAVGYVPVEQPTDYRGVIAQIPDPLLPQTPDGVSIVRGENQPFWIRVKPPKGARPGVYKGKTLVDALSGGKPFHAEIATEVRVFAFELPDEMTCKTAFGCALGTAFSYHKAKTQEDRRKIAEAYHKALSGAHLSPYNPAPLDGWKVEWKGLQRWIGATCEKDGSIKATDDSVKNSPCASWPEKFPCAPHGMLVGFDYRTDTAHGFNMSLAHQDAFGEWMPGRNKDVWAKGVPGEWKHMEFLHKEYPADAKTFRVSFFPAGWKNDGSSTGTLWLRNITVKNIATGEELLAASDSTKFDPAKATPVFHWEKWDKAVEEALTKHHFNSFVIHIDGVGHGSWEGEGDKPHFLGFSEDSSEYEILWDKYVKGIEAHLREKGWLDKAFVYWYDEPQPKAFDYVRRGMEKLKKHAPGLRRMLTVEPVEELADCVNLWCPLTNRFHSKWEPKCREQGDDFWWYICTGPKSPYATEFTDHPGAMLRLWLWQTWQNNVNGILIWETLWWTSPNAYPDKPQNPYLDAMSWSASSLMPKGTKRAWGNGDGRFLYPPLAAADGSQKETVLDPPNGSIRLEMLRDGIEDYEYLALLSRLLAEKPDEEFRKLLTVPEEISRSLVDFTSDPAPIERRRLELAQAIEKLIGEQK